MWFDGGSSYVAWHQQTWMKSTVFNFVLEVLTLGTRQHGDPVSFLSFFFFKYKETPFHRIIPQILPEVQSALRGKGRPKSERRLSDLWALARRAEKGSGAQKAAHRSQDQSSGLGFQFLANALHSKPGRDLGTFKVIKKLETIKKQWLKNHCYG